MVYFSAPFGAILFEIKNVDIITFGNKVDMKIALFSYFRTTHTNWLCQAEVLYLKDESIFFYYVSRTHAITELMNFHSRLKNGKIV